MIRNFRKSIVGLALGLMLAAGFVPQAHAGAMSNYLTNKLMDEVMRGQAYTGPTTVYVALATSTGSPAACGTEVSYTGYARVAVTASLANWSGTQGATTTAVSSGTSGTISNNGIITFGSPSSGPSVIVAFCIFDAASGGNLLWQGSLTTSKTVNASDSPPSFAVSALSWTVN